MIMVATGVNLAKMPVNECPTPVAEIYCRLGPDSDVELYRGEDKSLRVREWFGDEHVFADSTDHLRYLDSLRCAGKMIPRQTIERLRAKSRK